MLGVVAVLIIEEFADVNVVTDLIYRINANPIIQNVTKKSTIFNSLHSVTKSLNSLLFWLQTLR